jgi:hypothetical protein
MQLSMCDEISQQRPVPFIAWQQDPSTNHLLQRRLIR